MIRITDLYIYPVKGFAGIRVGESDLTGRGFAFDRRWMVVDAEGTFLTQRQRPEMALVRTALGPDGIDLGAPGMPEMRLPVQHEGGARRAARVWEHQGHAAVHVEGSDWISRYLGGPHQLVYMTDDERRPVSPEYGQPGDIVSFADGYPLLMISHASLADLNARLAAPVVMARFRPSVVVEGCAAYAEETWPRFRIGALSFRAPKRCARCAVITVDPATGERGVEPLRTLATYRSENNKVYFGMNVIADGTGRLRVGDAIEPLA